MSDGPGWYSVRCFFLHHGGAYEERITLWRADGIDAAIELAEAEAAEYAESLTTPEHPTVYLEYAQAYWLDDDPRMQGAEVYSLIRDSELPPSDYLDRFFDTGEEHTSSVE